MARRSTPSPGEAHTRLRWERARLEEELDRQLTKGAELQLELRGPNAVERVTELGAECGRWHQRNRTVLEQAFTRIDVQQQYHPPVLIASDTSRDPRPQAKLQELLGELDRRLQRLRSVRDRVDLYEEETPSGLAAAKVRPTATAGQEVFVVHGRDDGVKLDVARTLQQLTGRPPVVLHEQPNRGRTIIEKFEDHAGEAGADGRDPQPRRRGSSPVRPIG